ncbi:hypothetical protein [Shewanella litorisediminis]|uniref:Uncharacterized protein n=1 Tax=Shewanella litorisediminis TaxID=1173586 RepID=A0ABX7G4D3_9GAMM|nr:hypothetical protein [Shewanella litorisediminis]MCL2919952.1 hypothetical protein [Shewanella litorisediminis]QRH02127.1 hypothetical protein JQC75_01460 [Shewanella litorisediminis]
MITNSYVDNYKSQFLKALSFGNSFDSSQGLSVLELRKLLNKSMQKIPNEIYYKDVKNFILHYFLINGFTNPSHKCLEYSSRALQLLEDAQDRNIFPDVPVFLTIGNVRYKGEYVDSFKVTRNDIKRLVNIGPDLSKLKLHAWLTLHDLTVIDLTLNYSLYDQGKTQDDPDVLISWHKDSNYQFEPIVVSNLFDRLVCYGDLEPCLIK